MENNNTAKELDTVYFHFRYPGRLCERSLPSRRMELMAMFGKIQQHLAVTSTKIHSNSISTTDQSVSCCVAIKEFHLLEAYLLERGFQIV